MAKLLYQGHGSFRITTDKQTVIYVDPYIGEGYDRPADIILVTHQHFDHNRLDLIIKKPSCQIISNEQAISCNKHQTFKINDITIEAVPAYNKNHDISKCVGYIISFDNLKLYASGDTSTTTQMSTYKDLNLDYALLCCDGIYNMDLEEASACAKLINAKVTIPIHINPQKIFDLERAKKFNASNKLIIEPSQELTL